MIFKDTKKKKIAVYTLFVVLIIWSIILFFIDPMILIERFGVTNIYLLLFIVAVTAGTSAFTTTSFYAVFLSYVSAGFDPVAMGIIGGIGLAIGDSLFYYLAYKAGDVYSAEKRPLYIKAYNIAQRLPRYSVYIITFIYTGFLPIPHDILMVTLGFLRFKYVYIIPFVIVGNIIWLSLIAHGFHFFL
jgi:membrane protein YqaA with SNARE-associated domain